MKTVKNLLAVLTAAAVVFGAQNVRAMDDTFVEVDDLEQAITDEVAAIKRDVARAAEADRTATSTVLVRSVRDLVVGADAFRDKDAVVLASAMLEIAQGGLALIERCDTGGKIKEMQQKLLVIKGAIESSGARDEALTALTAQYQALKLTVDAQTYKVKTGELKARFEAARQAALGESTASASTALVQRSCEFQEEQAAALQRAKEQFAVEMARSAAASRNV